MKTLLFNLSTSKLPDLYQHATLVAKLGGWIAVDEDALAGHQVGVYGIGPDARYTVLAPEDGKEVPDAIMRDILFSMATRKLCTTHLTIPYGIDEKLELSILPDGRYKCYLEDREVPVDDEVEDWEVGTDFASEEDVARCAEPLLGLHGFQGVKVELVGTGGDGVSVTRTFLTVVDDKLSSVGFSSGTHEPGYAGNLALFLASEVGEVRHEWVLEFDVPDTYECDWMKTKVTIDIAALAKQVGAPIEIGGN